MADNPYSGSHREPVKSAYLEWGDPHLSPITAGNLHFDLVISEEHDRSCEVTEHNVEQGGNITDHVRPNLDRLTLEVLVTNVPLDAPAAIVQGMALDIPQPGDHTFLAGGTSALLDKGLVAIGLKDGFPQQITVNTLQFDGDTDFVQIAYQTLTRLSDEAVMLAITTPKEFYPNMILRSLVMRRDASTGTSATFTLDFQEIRLVSSQVVAAPLPSIPRAGVELSAGKKDVKDTAGDKESVAHKAKGQLQKFISSALGGP